MKKIILSVIVLLCTIYTLQAQVPQAINYQAVARTSQGLLIPNQQVSVRFSILESSINGTIIYQETATPTTNSFGLFTLGIGTGTPVTGTFAGINWGNGITKFLKVEIAPQVNGPYNLQGTTQIMSVPFALYAEKTKLLAGNNTIITNGNTITGNYQAANNTISITGNQIGGNYQAGNNTVTVTGNQISGNYQAGTGINVTGNTISGNYVAGTGINITGNTISSTGSSSFWQPDTYGIFYQNPLGGVGIGGNTESNGALTVTQRATGGFSAAAIFKGSDTWHTVLRIDNSSLSPLATYQIQVSGTNNGALPPGAFAIYRPTFSPGGVNDRFILVTDGTDNTYVGIGSYTNRATVPKSRLHVFAGDVNIDQIGSGIIMKSPNGQCWRVTIDNTGNFVRTAIICP
jgi:hypothetical protein